MPYADNDGVKIHYEVEGEGPPLVLMHGLGLNMDSWRVHGGYVNLLKNDYQLILVDARGHGKSDKLYNPEAYKLELIVSDVVAVLDDLKISRSHFYGYSMGAWIGWGIAMYVPNRFYSLILGGGGPPSERDPDTPNGLRDLYMQGMDKVLAFAEKFAGQRWNPQFKTIVQSRDLDALIAWTLSPDSTYGTPGYEKVIPTIKLPCLVFAGEESGEYTSAMEAVKNMPNATFVSFPGLNHLECLCRSDLVVPHIKKFLEQVEQANKH